MAKLRKFFQRMIAIALRICSQCDEEILEGEIYFKAKNAEVWCGACVDYDRDHE